MLNHILKFFIFLCVQVSLVKNIERSSLVETWLCWSSC